MVRGNAGKAGLKYDGGDGMDGRERKRNYIIGWRNRTGAGEESKGVFKQARRVWEKT